MNEQRDVKDENWGISDECIFFFQMIPCFVYVKHVNIIICFCLSFTLCVYQIVETVKFTIGNLEIKLADTVINDQRNSLKENDEYITLTDK